MWPGLIILLAMALILVLLLTGAALAYVLSHPPRRTLGRQLARGLPADPVEAGAGSFESQNVELGDGLSQEVWVVPGALADGAVVVLLHGWGDSRYGALAWLPVLLPVTGSVVLADLSGHGDHPRGGFGWGEREVEDVRRLAEWVGERQPGRAVVLAGLSVGGVLAIRAAAGPGVADAVIADSPYRRMQQPVAGVLRRLSVPRWPVLPIGLGLLRCWASPGLRRETTTDAAAMQVPLLVIHGRHDRLVPEADAVAIAAAPPQGQHQLVEDSHHLGAACTDPGAYTELLRRFLP